MLRRLDGAGMRLKQEKCKFNQPRMEYLGHIFSKQGISLSETKVQAIRDAPEPTNVTELKAFLGLLNYYGRFLPNLLETLHPLYALLGKNRPCKWESKKQEHSKRETKASRIRIPDTLRPAKASESEL